MTSAQSIWTKHVSARQARAVGAALRAAGYSISNDKVRSLGCAINIGSYLEPGDTTARNQIHDIICQAAGFQPREI